MVVAAIVICAVVMAGSIVCARRTTTTNAAAAADIVLCCRCHKIPALKLIGVDISAQKSAFLLFSVACLLLESPNN